MGRKCECVPRFVGSRHGQSVKASLEAGELIVTEVDEGILKKFDTEADMKAYVTSLKYWEQELHTHTKENYNKFSVVICQRLSTVYGVLCSICDIRLRNRMEAEPKYQDMLKTKRYCAIKLLDLVRKMCNGSTCVIVDDVIGNLIESLCNVVLIRGDDFKSLPR